MRDLRDLPEWSGCRPQAGHQVGQRLPHDASSCSTYRAPRVGDVRDADRGERRCPARDHHGCASAIARPPPRPAPRGQRRRCPHGPHPVAAGLAAGRDDARHGLPRATDSFSREPAALALRPGGAVSVAVSRAPRTRASSSVRPSAPCSPRATTTRSSCSAASSLCWPTRPCLPDEARVGTLRRGALQVVRPTAPALLPGSSWSTSSTDSSTPRSRCTCATTASRSPLHALVAIGSGLILALRSRWPCGCGPPAIPVTRRLRPRRAEP